MYQLKIKKELREVFNYDSKITEIAEDIIDRIDDQEDDSEEISDLLYSAADDSLIYKCDRWDLIKYYSDPDDPLTFNDALDCFIEELSSNCYLEETEE